LNIDDLNKKYISMMLTMNTKEDFHSKEFRLHRIRMMECELTVELKRLIPVLIDNMMFQLEEDEDNGDR
jgi:hypothetical protein